MQLRPTERGADPVPPYRCSPRAERAALPPRHALASRGEKKQTKTFAGRVQFVAVLVGTQVQPYTCYWYGPYTCLHLIAELPPARVGLRVAMPRAEGARKARRSRGQEERAGAGAEGRRRGLGRGWRQRAAPGHSFRPRLLHLNRRLSQFYGFTLSNRFRDPQTLARLAGRRGQLPRGLCSDGRLPFLGWVMMSS